MRQVPVGQIVNYEFLTVRQVPVGQIVNYEFLTVRQVPVGQIINYEYYRTLLKKYMRPELYKLCH